MIDKSIIGRMKEGNESITQVAGTPSIKVTKLAEEKITERLHEEDDKRQKECKMIYFELKEDGNLETKEQTTDKILKEEILSITRLGKKKEGS